MRYYKHDDPDAFVHLQHISHRIRNLQEDEIPFFIVVDGDHPAGMVVVRVEPTYFLAEAGATFGEIVVFEPDIDALNGLLEISRHIMNQETFAYLILAKQHFSDDEQNILEQFGFKMIDHSYHMGMEVSEFYEIPDNLVLKPMRLQDMDLFLDTEMKFYEGTGDSLTPVMMQNIRNASSDVLESIYNEDTSYFVIEGESVIGIVVIFIDNGAIASLAVKPEYRGKGYGKKLVQMALNRLKELGWSKIVLRVHAENITALRLYESMGFHTDIERIAYVLNSAAR